MWPQYSLYRFFSIASRSAQYFGDCPGLRDAAFGREWGIAVEDFAAGAEPCFGQMGGERF